MSLKATASWPISSDVTASIRWWRSPPATAVALAQSWRAGFGMLFWIIGIHALEAYFLNPKIMGNAAKMHPVVVVFALIAGERTYGLLGALFAVPVAAVLVACFEFARRKAQPVAVDLLER